MRNFDNRQRHQAANPFEPGGLARQLARNQQDAAAHEDRERHEGRHDLRNPVRHGARALTQQLPAVTGLVESQQHGRQQKRQNIIDGPVGQQSADYDGRRQVGPQQHEHGGLEHADAARNLACQSGHLGQQEDAHEGRKADAARQQHEQHSAGQQPVKAGEHKLRQGQT